jgi:hypothetical protein
MGAHGVGEIGITGVAAAVANAVYNATGKRLRDLPITLGSCSHSSSKLDAEIALFFIRCSGFTQGLNERNTPPGTHKQT